MASDAEETTAQQAVREINEAVHEMHLTMADFDHTMLEVVEQRDVQEPLSEPEVREKLSDWHSICMLVFTRLRPHVRTHLEEEFWETTEYPALCVEVDGEDGETTVGGLQILDDLHSPYDISKEWTRGRSQRPQARVRSQANLMQPSFYRSVTEVLTECQTKLGFGPTPNKQTTRSEITEEHVEKVETWRQENIDETEARA